MLTDKSYKITFSTEHGTKLARIDDIVIQLIFRLQSTSLLRHRGQRVYRDVMAGHKQQYQVKDQIAQQSYSASVQRATARVRLI